MRGVKAQGEKGESVEGLYLTLSSRVDRRLSGATSGMFSAIVRQLKYKTSQIKREIKCMKSKKNKQIKRHQYYGVRIKMTTLQMVKLIFN